MDRNFQVGDEVAIREWADMAAEFGSSSSYIPCRFHFVSEMRILCGRTGYIRALDDGRVWIVDDNGRDIATAYSISTDMIRHADSFTFSETDFQKLIGGVT